MKKHIILLALLLLAGMSQAAEKAPSLTLYGDYGYNLTWENYGGASLIAEVPINEHFECELGVQALSSNVHTINADLRPVFPLPVGDLYLSTRVVYTAAVRNDIQDIAAAVGIGYRMDYINVQFGVHGRMMNAFERDKHSPNQILFELPHLLYGVEVFVRPSTSPWNMSLYFGNYDDFQIERMWQPIFRLGGSYKIDTHWQLLADVTCKPTGMFHLNACFYGVHARIGASYAF